MAVDVGVKDLIRSYVSLRNGAGETSGSAASLLLCYGVECGMKAAILGKNGLNARGTHDLPCKLRNHDLRKLAKHLNLDGTVAAALAPCRRKHNGQVSVEPHQLHEAWRYGATLHDEDEKCALEALRKLSEWCRKEHNQ